MKKLFSILLTFAMVLGMGSVAQAETKTPFSKEYPKQLTLTKVYDVRGETGEAPVVDKMTFTINPDEVLEREDETPPKFKELTLEVPEGKGSVDFPQYTNVGTYVYRIKENTPNPSTAGVTYDAPEMELKVTVVEKDEDFVVYQYAIRVVKGENVKKTDEAHNTYEAGSLEVTKEVTGNFGDKKKEFVVEVEFTKPERTTIGSVISYGEKETEKETEKIQPGDWGDKETVTREIHVKDGTNVTFNNIPKGVKWKVVEKSYENEGYTTSYESSSETDRFATGEIDNSETDTVKIVNNKNADVDTGISLDSIPYIMILGLAVLGISGLFLRRRKNADF